MTFVPVDGVGVTPVTFFASLTAVASVLRFLGSLLKRALVAKEYSLPVSLGASGVGFFGAAGLVCGARAGVRAGVRIGVRAGVRPEERTCIFPSLSVTVFGLLFS